MCAFYFALVRLDRLLLQFYDVVRTELPTPHRIDRVFGQMATLLQCCFSRQTHHWAVDLFLFLKTTKPKSIFDLRIFSMLTQTANKRLRTFHRLCKGIKFHFQQDCPFQFLIKTLSSYIGGERWCICFHYLKARVKQAKYLFRAVAYKSEISYTQYR